jgi:hypothetical protein
MNKKSYIVKLALTIPALCLGIFQTLKLLAFLLGNCLLFLFRITGIMFIFKPVLLLWSGEPAPQPTPEEHIDSQEDHDFH